MSEAPAVAKIVSGYSGDPERDWADWLADRGW